MADENDTVVNGDFGTRLNFGIDAGWDYPFENDDVLLMRTRLAVNGKMTTEYHLIMKDDVVEEA